MSPHIFVRFGGVNLVKQKGFSTPQKTFHAPPASIGIYAFPIKAVELFLIGGGYDGLKFEDKLKTRKQFTHDGMIWSHLGEYIKPVDVFARHGSWVKSTVKVWYKAFVKQSLAKRYGDDEYFKTNSINEPVRSGFSGMYGRDYLEVFFDEKVS